MNLSVNSKNFFVRLILGLIAVLMGSVGYVVLRQSFVVEQPHIFVMLIFSGSLTLLVGLACLVGLVASFWPPPQAEQSYQDQDMPTDTDNINDLDSEKHD